MKRLLLYCVALLTLLSQSSCGYNGMVQRDQTVKAQWGAVQSAYQRRADLIPNLVNTVKGAANFEKSTLEGVIEARAKATSVNISADQLTPENIQKFQAAQSQLSSGLGRLLAVSENYPQLKANENFQELQAQLEGTEKPHQCGPRQFQQLGERLQHVHPRSFPNNLFAGMFGFAPKGYFEADPSAKDAPKVDFGDTGGTPSGTSSAPPAAGDSPSLPTGK